MSSVINITDGSHHRKDFYVGSKVRLRGIGKAGGIGTILKLSGNHSAAVKWQSGFTHIEFLRNLTKVTTPYG